MELYEDDLSDLEVTYGQKFHELTESRMKRTGCLKTYPLQGGVFGSRGYYQVVDGIGWTCSKNEVHESRYDNETGESYYYNVSRKRWGPLDQGNAVNFILDD